ncbi:MAG: ParB/RepB/Spo0J family partition protein [Lachnospiraceae bacterium]|nr:ParB/RepB/Spo0J family partition protein [Lachnospiraceae bacterium]MCI6621624.1 ParB/RepB/Spo0J family partition protein [Bacillota bacterium]
MPKKGLNVSLQSYDDIFSTEETRQDAQLEKVQQIPLGELHPFKNHPFKVIDDEAMLRTVESIAQFGVLSPAIARPRPEGGYELVSGHRRHHAAAQAGLDTMPVIVRDLDDDAAVCLMVDSNLQRESILPSERAFAYKMKLEAMKRQAGRPSKENSCQVGTHLRSDQVLGEQVGESARTVQRYIRLTYLIPELLEKVDNKEIAFNPAVEISYLTEDEQRDFLEALDYSQAAPSLSQAQEIKRLSQKKAQGPGDGDDDDDPSGGCSLDAMCDIMERPKKSENSQVSISTDKLQKYFPKSYTPKQI